MSSSRKTDVGIPLEHGCEQEMVRHVHWAQGSPAREMIRLDVDIALRNPQSASSRRHSWKGRKGRV